MGRKRIFEEGVPKALVFQALKSKLKKLNCALKWLVIAMEVAGTILLKEDFILNNPHRKGELINCWTKVLKHNKYIENAY